MGNWGSTPEFKLLQQHSQYEEWNTKFDALLLKKSVVQSMHKKFCFADMDHSGTIDLVEMLTILDLEKTRFTQRVFSIFDEDRSGKIDFGEFVLSLWNYCTLSRTTLGMFAFDLYDRDGTGILEDRDIEMMIKDIYGKNASNTHYGKQVVRDLELMKKQYHEVSLEVFVSYTATKHSLLFPAFQMQLSLQQKIMGENFWKKHAERRMKISRNKYMKVKEFLEKSSLNIVEEQLAKKFVRKAKDAFNFSGSLADRRKRNYIMTEEKTGSLVAINRLSEDEPVYRKKSKVVPMKSAEEQVKSLIEHYDAYDKDEQLQRKDALTAAAKEILAGEVGGEGPLIAKTYESDSDEYEKNKSRRGGSFLHSTSRKPSMFASFFGQSTKVKRDTITSTFSRDGNDEAKQQGNEGADNKLEKEEATGDFLTETLSSASQPLRRKSYDSTGEQTPTESKNNSVLSPTSQRRKSIAAKTNNDQQDEIVGLVPSRKGRKSSASSKREGSSLVDNDHPLARKIADVDSTLAALSNKPSVKNAAPNSAALPPIRSNAHNRPLSANPSSKTNSVDASGKQRVSVIVSTSVTKPIIYVTK